MQRYFSLVQEIRHYGECTFQVCEGKSKIISSIFEGLSPSLERSHMDDEVEMAAVTD